MSVTLRKRSKPNKKGLYALFLDIYPEGGGKRVFETLKGLHITEIPADASPTLRKRLEKANKEMYERGQIKALERARQIETSETEDSFLQGRKVKVLDWMGQYVEAYKLADKRNMQAVFKKFTHFLEERKQTGLTFRHLKAPLVQDFVNYLIQTSALKGADTGVVSYFARYKKMLRRAELEGLLLTNPASKDKIKFRRGEARKKESLNLDEVRILMNTPTNATEVRRAFLFSLKTGFSFSDVSNLKWKDVNLHPASPQITKYRGKTHTPVVIPITDEIKYLLGPKKANEHPVFTLPSHNGANKAIKQWVQRAGINKNVTFHCARHSYAMIMAELGVNAVTIQQLMGHKSLRHTNSYISHVSNTVKRDTLNLLNTGITREDGPDTMKAV